MNSSATATRPVTTKGDTAVAASTPAATEAAVKPARKARTKVEGLNITFRITNADEIKKLTDLATADRRTPDNYVALLAYKHLMGHAPITSGAEAAAV
jgi:hypothetical protein